MRGTWQATSSGGAGALAASAAVLAVGAGAAMLATAVAEIMWVLVAGMALAAAVIIYAAVRLNRRVPVAPPAMRAQFVRPAPVQAVSAPPSVAALPPAEQHIHFHVNSAAEAAEILARRDR